MAEHGERNLVSWTWRAEDGERNIAELNELKFSYWTKRDEVIYSMCAHLTFLISSSIDFGWSLESFKLNGVFGGRNALSYLDADCRAGWMFS